MRLCAKMKPTITPVIGMLLLLTTPIGSGARIVKSSPTSFTIAQELFLPVPPEEAYDAMTGDISGWWDHSFSGEPAKLFIEPRPGGGFVELFDESGNGALHATVTYADRGKLLRLVGPLGLAGNPFTMVMTFVFKPAKGGTTIELTASSIGEMQDGWDTAVDGVWYHFLFERLKPWVEAGNHLKRD